MLAGATPMRLASVLVSSPKFTAEEKRQVPRRNGDKNGPESGSARIMRRTLQLHKEQCLSLSLPQLIAPPALVILSICICTYLYVKWTKDKKK